MRQREEKFRPDIGLGFGPNLAAVSVNDARDGRKPDAGSMELIGRMKPAERLEQTRRIAHVEACTAVRDTVDGLISASTAVEPNPDPLALLTVFPGVVDQVIDERGHEPAIGHYDHARLNVSLDLDVPVGFLKRF